MNKIIIGQEAICPKGLGRVVDYLDNFPFRWIQVRTYEGSTCNKWDSCNVELIDPINKKSYKMEDSTDNPQKQSTVTSCNTSNEDEASPANRQHSGAELRLAQHFVKVITGDDINYPISMELLTKTKEFVDEKLFGSDTSNN